jgi:hypothetical protein
VTGQGAALLALAGVGGGLTGSVAGLASLVSYPALLASGLPPLTANVTNTVAVVLSSVGSTLGSRTELVGQGPRMRRLLVASAAGGLLGAVLLLATPADSFERVVPWLIAVGSVAVLVPRRAPAPGPVGPDARALTPVVALVAVYGGYFGAGAGVIMLAVLLAATSEDLPRGNAAKNVVMGVANGVAAVALAVLHPVPWSAAVPLALGFLVGGRLGPVVVRRLPASALRLLIALCGLGLALHLGLA